MSLWNMQGPWQLGGLFCLSIPCTVSFGSSPHHGGCLLDVHHWGSHHVALVCEAKRGEKSGIVSCPSPFQCSAGSGCDHITSYPRAVPAPPLQLSPASSKAVFPHSVPPVAVHGLSLLAPVFCLSCWVLEPCPHIFVGFLLRGPLIDTGAQGRAVLGRVAVEGVAVGEENLLSGGEHWQWWTQGSWPSPWCVGKGWRVRSAGKGPGL